MEQSGSTRDSTGNSEDKTKVRDKKGGGLEREKRKSEEIKGSLTLSCFKTSGYLVGRDRGRVITIIFS